MLILGLIDLKDYPKDIKEIYKKMREEYLNSE